MKDPRNKFFVVAALLKKHALRSPNSELANICSAGLEDVGQYLDEYETVVQIASDFVKELHNSVDQLVEFKNITVHKLEDAAFNLFEPIAVIMREMVLRNKGNSPPRPVQGEILRSFEDSENWLPEDSTLVSEYYYHKIPASLAARDDSKKAPAADPDNDSDKDDKKG